jgi:hypothetical protein
MPIRFRLATPLLALVTISAFATAQQAPRGPQYSPLAPFKAGDRYFFVAPNGKLYVKDGRDATPRALLAAGTFTVLAPSPDGKYLAYGVAGSGTTSYQVRVRNVSTARDLSGALDHASISLHPWTHNNKGFFYTREDMNDHHRRIYFHSVDNPQARDGIVYSRLDEPDWTYSVRVSDDGEFAVITIFHPQDDHTRLYFIDLDDPDHPTLDAPVVKLVDNFGSRYTFVDNGGSFFFLQTDRDAPNGRIILANTDIIRESRWQTVVPESADTLLFARTAGDQYLITVSRNNGKTFSRVYAPPSSKELEQEFRHRADSIRKAEGDHAPQRNGPGMGGMPRGMRPYGMPMFRMNLIREITMPSNATLLDMTSNAYDKEVLYTVTMSDGTTRSYLYDISNRDNNIFNTTPGGQ